MREKAEKKKLKDHIARSRSMENHVAAAYNPLGSSVESQRISMESLTLGNGFYRGGDYDHGLQKARQPQRVERKHSLRPVHRTDQATFEERSADLDISDDDQYGADTPTATDRRIITRRPTPPRELDLHSSIGRGFGRRQLHSDSTTANQYNDQLERKNTINKKQVSFPSDDCLPKYERKLSGTYYSQEPLVVPADDFLGLRRFRIRSANPQTNGIHPAQKNRGSARRRHPQGFYGSAREKFRRIIKKVIEEQRKSRLFQAFIDATKGSDDLSPSGENRANHLRDTIYKRNGFHTNHNTRLIRYGNHLEPHLVPQKAIQNGAKNGSKFSFKQLLPKLNDATSNIMYKIAPGGKYTPLVQRKVPTNGLVRRHSTSDYVYSPSNAKPINRSRTAYAKTNGYTPLIDAPHAGDDSQFYWTPNGTGRGKNGLEKRKPSRDRNNNPSKMTWYEVNPPQQNGYFKHDSNSSRDSTLTDSDSDEVFQPEVRRRKPRKRSTVLRESRSHGTTEKRGPVHVVQNGFGVNSVPNSPYVGVGSADRRGSYGFKPLSHHHSFMQTNGHLHATEFYSFLPKQNGRFERLS